MTSPTIFDHKLMRLREKRLIREFRPQLWLDGRVYVAANLVANPGFETLGGGGADVFAGWTETGSDGSTVTDGGAESDSGSRCCCLTISNPANGLAQVKQDVLTVGQTYALTFRAKADGVCTMSLASPATTYTLSTSYQTFSTTFVATNVSLNLKRLTAPGRIIYIDNVSCRAVPESVADGNLVTQWTGRQTGAAVTFPQTNGHSQPTWTAATKSLTFAGTDDCLKKATATLTGAASGRVMIVAKTTVTDAEQVLYSQADEATADQFLKLGISSDNKIWYEFDNGAGVTQVELKGNTVLGTDWHVLEWVSSGSAISMLVDGTPQEITVVGGTNAGQWFGDVTGADNSLLGAAQTSAGVVAPLTGDIAEMLAWEPDDTTANATRLRTSVARITGVTLSAMLMLAGTGVTLADNASLWVGAAGRLMIGQ